MNKLNRPVQGVGTSPRLGRLIGVSVYPFATLAPGASAGEHPCGAPNREGMELAFSVFATVLAPKTN
ncbi:MAG TPA: hypothetical protein VFQ23_07885 [Anaerolineales bacterium]|nr:hypothetical protein [Anaerolineales bacterium]